MRTIRFRGRDIENGQPWRYGSLIQYPTGECAIVVTDSDAKELSYDVDPDTVGMYTGLQDINGKDIYEDDILEHICNADNNIPRTFQVLWDEGDASLRCKVLLNSFAFYYLYSANWGATFIIGNIHDNPELMEGGHQ